MDPAASMRKKRKARKKMRAMSDLFDTVFILFPFWCLDAKGGEEIYLPMSFIVFIRTWLVRL
jgi:hypothetical protein